MVFWVPKYSSSWAATCSPLLQEAELIDEQAARDDTRSVESQVGGFTARPLLTL